MARSKKDLLFQVSGFLVRSKENKLDIIGLREPDEPKKRDDAAPRFKYIAIYYSHPKKCNIVSWMLLPCRVIFNSEKDTPQKMILRPEGIVPNSENDVRLTVAETESSYEGVSVTPYGTMSPGAYDLYWNEEKIANINIGQGGIHTFVVYEDEQKEGPQFADFLLTPENTLHIFWLFPQYFVITVGEIMFSITALEFSYSQVKLNMHNDT